MPPWGAVGEGKLKKDGNDDKEDSEKEEEKQDNKEYLKNGKYYAEDIKQGSDFQNVPENAPQYAASYSQYNSDQVPQAAPSNVPESSNIQQEPSQVTSETSDSTQSATYTQDQTVATTVRDSASEEINTPQQTADQSSSQASSYDSGQSVYSAQQQASQARDATEAEASSVHQEDNGNSAKRSSKSSKNKLKSMRVKRNSNSKIEKRSRQERFPFWLAAEDFDRLARFIHDTGLKLIFDLNGFFRRPDGAWDATNAIDIVRHVKDEGYDIVWELGNEPNRYSSYGQQRVLSATQVAQDTIRLRSLLMRSQHFGSVILGPGISRPGVSNSEKYLKEFLNAAAWAIDAVTWHQYYKGRKASIEDFMDPRTLDVFKKQVEKINKIVTQSRSGKPVWLGETGSTWGGGVPGVSNVYAASFMFLDKLGLAALYCNQVVIRQSLIGGSYALLDDDFTPRPDYWAALIHKKLVGRKVFEVTGGDHRLRVYAHCTKSKAGYPGGSLTIIALNLWKKTTAKIEFQGSLRKQNIDEYLVTSSNGKLTSKTVDLNGEELHLSSGIYVPKLHPIQTKAPLKLPPRSYAFYVIPLANSKRCF